MYVCMYMYIFIMYVYIQECICMYILVHPQMHARIIYT